ncbi:DUF4446 family protein [Senegalia massiliensis]|uniref:DUF4446 family protein n=1 Tax=Senegalia massiliensis TaxID=1720316 RepID=A0A845R127_9CLOT|nr:DUF4446 family protein [Senegalia massiliensis]NBI08130.1 DUF4446 family protein [Senegalia massiliensis]
MDSILEMLSLYRSQVLLGLILFSLLLFLLFLIQEYRVSKLKKKYKTLLVGNDGKNLEEILFKNIDMIDSMKLKIKGLDEKSDLLNEKVKSSIQKVGMIRYNAFDDMGSDLSFSVALLDENDTGLVISNLYGRNESIGYGKPVINGESEYKLSIEEIQAIDRAKRKALYMEDKVRRATR